MSTKKREELSRLYYWLASARALCNVLKRNRAKIHGPLLTAMGQEAIGAGIVWGLHELGIAEKSWKDGDHRTLWSLTPAMSDILGVDLSYEFIKNHYLKATSPDRGRDANVHFGFPEHRIGGFDVSHMAAMIGVSAGRAEALRMLEYDGREPSKRPVVVSCFGEGAAQQGVVHEVMNWVAASNAPLSEKELSEQEPFLDDLARKTGVQRGAPLIVVIQVNQKSLYTDPREEHGNAHKGRPSHFAQRALGYPGWCGLDVDGDDPLEVADAIKIAAHRAQRLEGSSLIIAHTYRRTAHNEDQHGTLTSEEKMELEASWASEPLKRFANYLISHQILSEREIDEIENRAEDEMNARSESALEEQNVSLEEDQKDSARFAPHVYTLQEVKPAQENSRLVPYNTAALMVLEECLRNDSSVTFCGEDIAHPTGGVFALWRGLEEKFGNGRVFNTPISEEALVANLVGRASMGLKPWGEYEYAPFGKESLVIVDYVVGANFYQKKRLYPIVLLNHFGVVGEGGSGHYHSDCTEADFFHNQGWKVVFPADAYDLAGLLRAANEDPNPVVIYMQIYAHGKREFRRLVPNEPYMIPLGKAAVKREGKDVTVVVYGACAVQAALNEAEELAKEGIECEVVDLRTVVPLDIETIAVSAKKTGRVIIMHEASRKGGVGAYIKDDLDSDVGVWSRLRAPIVVLAAKDIPIPSASVLEWDRLPFELEKRENDTRLRSRRLAEAVRDAMKF
ncbi:MAG: hypothetical protein HYV65_02600 [Candidatus Spechtbacteria bacterium]|nr:hypothetical protein [Candidatus Spechtbacteria bacterium]